MLNKKNRNSDVILKKLKRIKCIIPLFIVFVLILLFFLAHFNKNEVIKDSIAYFKEPETVIKLNLKTLGKQLPTTKEEGKLPVLVSIKVDKDWINVYGTIKVQGMGSAPYPKKNWKIRLYEDKENSKPLKIKIGDSIASNKWIAKAEWIDPTLIRNALSYKLWGDIVKSRERMPQNEVDLYKEDYNFKTLAQGYPKVYPIQIKVNNRFYGLSILTLGHDPDNFNIDKNNPNHVYMEFDARYGTPNKGSWDNVKSESIGQCIKGYFPQNDDFTTRQKGSIDNLGEFINSPLPDFKRNFDNYLDKTNIIDILLFYEAIYDYDATAYDTEMVSYDLKKWFFLPWDKDSTFGLGIGSFQIIEDSENKLLFNYTEMDQRHIPWYKTYHAFQEEVEKRYADLRDKGVFTVNNLKALSDEVYNKITDKMWKEEQRKWNYRGRHKSELTDREQLFEWFEKRLIMLDKHFNYK